MEKFNPELINQLIIERRNISDKIDGIKNLAKFKIKGWEYYPNEFEFESKNVIVSSWWYYEIDHVMIHSDDLLDAIVMCFCKGEHPDEINDVEVKDVNLTFLIEHYETIKNHPESSKLIMLLESLNENNIELMRVILGIIE